MSLDGRKFWITSDSHFGHKEILNFERGKRFSSIKEHDDFILQKWDEWMTKCDKEKGGVFIFLGDLGYVSKDRELYDKICSMFGKHPCEKLAIFGNHDKDNEGLMYFLFDAVSTVPVYIDDRVILSHEPEACWSHQLNIHGHLHNSWLSDPQHLCASIQVANYNPITLPRITSALGKLPKKDYRFLYEPWAENYVGFKGRIDVIRDKSGHVDVSASRAYRRMLEDKEQESKLKHKMEQEEKAEKQKTIVDDILSSIY